MLDVTMIRQIANQSETAKSVFNELLKRQRSRAQINLRKFKYDILVNGIRVVDDDFIACFEQLETLGIGKLNYKGSTAVSFKWNYRLRDVAELGLAGGVLEKTDTPIDVTRPDIKPVIRFKATPVNITKPEPRHGTISMVFNIPSDVSARDLSALIELVSEIKTKQP